MSEWQPIETAPKDGTRIIINSDWDGVTMAEWEEAVGSGWPAGYYDIGTFLHRPDKWMPLPTPPKGSGNG